MAKQFTNRQNRPQSRFRNRQINKPNRRPLQSQRPLNRRRFNNAPNNNQPFRNRNRNVSRNQNRPAPAQNRFSGKQGNNNFRQLRNRRRVVAGQRVGSGQNNNNQQQFKNLKFEEGLDKQLDTYWGKAESEETKKVYQFNKEKNMDDELDSYWNNKGHRAQQQQVQKDETQQQQDNDHDANPI